MTNYDVVKKLIGNAMPIGDSTIDAQIYENLKELIKLHSEIHKVIDDVAYDFRDDKRASIKKCCDEASKYLDSLGIVD